MAMPDVVALNLQMPVVFMGCFGSTLISSGNISLFQRREVSLLVTCVPCVE